MDDSFLFDWLKGSAESKNKDEPILSEERAGPDLSKVKPDDFNNIFKDDADLNESERVAKSSLKDYMMLIHVMRTAAKSDDPNKLLMIALDPDQVKRVVEAISTKYGAADDIAMSITSQMIMATMLAAVIGSKYHVPPKS